ncbi:hypothetical protein Tco_1150316 [Tanacetum coccineum]
MMHPTRLHGHMRKKLRCVKAGLTYPKKSCLVTRGRMMDLGVPFCSTWRANKTESGASDADCHARSLMDYEAETETTFKLHHCWVILKDGPKWMQSELPKFATKSKGGSKRYKSSGSSLFNTEPEEASINLNANVGDDNEDEVDVIRDGKSGERRTVSLFRDQKEGGDVWLAMEELRAEIKAKYEMQY